MDRQTDRQRESVFSLRVDFFKTSLSVNGVSTQRKIFRYLSCSKYFLPNKYFMKTSIVRSSKLDILVPFLSFKKLDLMTT
jgi:hypothetical protein